MSVAVRKWLPEDASEGRREVAKAVRMPRVDMRKLTLGLKGWVVFYFLWACIFSQTSFDPNRAVAAPDAPAAVSSVSPS